MHSRLCICRVIFQQCFPHASATAVLCLFGSTFGVCLGLAEHCYCGRKYSNGYCDQQMLKLEHRKTPGHRATLMVDRGPNPDLCMVKARPCQSHGVFYFYAEFFSRKSNTFSHTLLADCMSMIVDQAVVYLYCKRTYMSCHCYLVQNNCFVIIV